MHLVAEEVAVGGEGGDVAAGEVRDDEALARQRQVQRRRQRGGRVQRAQQVAERCVHQDGAVCGEEMLEEIAKEMVFPVTPPPRRFGAPVQCLYP